MSSCGGKGKAEECGERTLRLYHSFTRESTAAKTSHDRLDICSPRSSVRTVMLSINSSGEISTRIFSLRLIGAGARLAINHTRPSSTTGKYLPMLAKRPVSQQSCTVRGNARRRMINLPMNPYKAAAAATTVTSQS